MLFRQGVTVYYGTTFPPVDGCSGAAVWFRFKVRLSFELEITGSRIFNKDYSRQCNQSGVTNVAMKI